MTGNKLTPVVEAYFTDLRLIRASGGVTNERSVYVPLTNLLNAVGGALRPRCHDYDSAISFGVTYESEDPQREGSGLYFANTRGRK